MIREEEETPKIPSKIKMVSQSLEKEMEGEVSLTPEPKKKSYREPSLAMPVETRSHKLDVGTSTKRGRRSEKRAREEETKRILVDGRQRTILDCTKITK